ncbi:hypothetical protein GCM10028818_60110 [Spirosoma horti]
MKLATILSGLVLTPAVINKIQADALSLKKAIEGFRKVPVKRTEGPQTHYLKVADTFFDSLVDGSKPFEARLNDREFKTGDTLRLSEYKNNAYTGRVIFATVTYVLQGGNYGIKKGFVVMGIQLIQNSFRSTNQA